MRVSEAVLFLQRSRDGESDGSDQLLCRAYEELKRLAAALLAREKPGHPLEPSALVHEAWLRLVDSEGRMEFRNHAHLFSAAAEMMRWLLIDAARYRLAVCHGGKHERVDLEGIEIAAPGPADYMLVLHEALDRLAVIDLEKARVVDLRFLTGLSIQETADVLGVSDRTVRRHWAVARAWLLVTIRDEMARN